MASSDSPIIFAEPDITDADVAAVTAVMRSGWITTGEQVNQLESSLRAYLAIEHVIAVSSCTAAIEIAAAFLDLPPGSKVGVPTWTFASSGLAAVHNGLHPVLLDVDDDTLNVSVDALSSALEDGLDAVIGVHFGGVPFDRQVRELCRSAGIPLIEDAAHALGAIDDRGRLAGRGSVGACFSFYATKNLTSAEGGAIATDDADFADFARSYRMHGMSKDAWARYHPGAKASYDVVLPGIKANLPDMLAALANSQFARFASMQARRRELVTRYRSNLADATVRFIPGEPDPDSADHLCAVLLPEGSDRDAISTQMSGRGISTSVHFRPLHQFAWFAKNASIGRSGVETADRVATRALSLPLHTGLSLADVDRVCDALWEALRR